MPLDLLGESVQHRKCVFVNVHIRAMKNDKKVGSLELGHNDDTKKRQEAKPNPPLSIL